MYRTGRSETTQYTVQTLVCQVYPLGERQLVAPLPAEHQTGQGFRRKNGRALSIRRGEWSHFAEHGRGHDRGVSRRRSPDLPPGYLQTFALLESLGRWSEPNGIQGLHKNVPSPLIRSGPRLVQRDRHEWTAKAGYPTMRVR